MITVLVMNWKCWISRICDEPVDWTSEIITVYWWSIPRNPIQFILQNFAFPSHLFQFFRSTRLFHGTTPSTYPNVSWNPWAKNIFYQNSNCSQFIWYQTQRCFHFVLFLSFVINDVLSDIVFRLTLVLAVTWLAPQLS